MSYSPELIMKSNLNLLRRRFSIYDLEDNAKPFAVVSFSGDNFYYECFEHFHEAQARLLDVRKYGEYPIGVFDLLLGFEFPITSLVDIRNSIPISTP